jgi:hypothetical protein
MEVILLAILLIAIAIGGFAIKMFFIPGSSFKKQCGSTFDPVTGQPVDCACASGRPEECQNTESEDQRETDLIIKPYKGKA